MQLDDMTHDCQSQAHPGMGACAAAVCLPKAVEHVGQELRRDADACVRDLNANLCLGLFQLHIDTTAGRCELDRVGQQVPDHLLQPVRIAAHDCG